MTTRLLSPIRLALPVCVAFAAPALAQTAPNSITPLTPSSSGGEVTVLGVNDAGQAVGKEFLDSGGTGAVAWFGTSPWTSLDVEASDSAAHGISNDGAVIAGVFNGDSVFRMARRANGTFGFFALPTFSGASYTSSKLSRDLEGVFVGGAPLSSDGSTIVGSSITATYERHAFRCVGECRTLQDLGVIGGASLPVGRDSLSGSSSALGVNADGTVVTGISTTPPDESGWQRLHGFYWTQAGGMEDLGTLTGPSGYSMGKALSADGSVVAGESMATNGEYHATVWTRSGTGFKATDIGPDGFTSTANAISAAGTIVVGEATENGGGGFRAGAAATTAAQGRVFAPPPAGFTGGAFYWTQAAGIQNLGALLTAAGVNLGGASLNAATAISPNGQLIAVNGTNGAGAPTPYLVRYAPGASGVTTRDAVQDSVDRLAQDRGGQMIAGRVTPHVLLGGNEQVNCTPCFSAFGSVGSFSAGAHGRLALGDNLTILMGAAYGQRESRGYDVLSSGTFALSARYDFVDWGGSRPFVEAGGYLSPADQLRYRRRYANGAGTAVGLGSTHATSYTVFGRLGWVWRLSPIDEVAVMADVSHTAQRVRSYVEQASAQNPFDAVVSGGTDRMNAARIGAQWTHLFAGKVEANVNLGLVRTFGSKSGLNIAVTGFGAFSPTIRNVTFVEYGGRLGFRLAPNKIIDVFANAQSGPQPVGTQVHGGVAYRYNF
ncbi:MAG: hypothetical protein IPL88_07815 [Rhizobiales bacterium]|nr:hypothetical protein [Hyphomicrobiales bacterium]